MRQTFLIVMAVAGLAYGDPATKLNGDKARTLIATLKAGGLPLKADKKTATLSCPKLSCTVYTNANNDPTDPSWRLRDVSCQDGSGKTIGEAQSLVDQLQDFQNCAMGGKCVYNVAVSCSIKLDGMDDSRWSCTLASND
jgi:hypothetical protein